MSQILTELKARKAKFGFKCDSIGLHEFIPLGKLLESLHNTYADDGYSVELVGMHGRDLRIYTDAKEIADWIRTDWCILT